MSDWHRPDNRAVGDDTDQSAVDIHDWASRCASLDGRLRFERDCARVWSREAVADDPADDPLALMGQDVDAGRGR